MASSLQAPEFQPFFQHAGPIEYSERRSSYCGPVTLAILLHIVLFYYILQSTNNILVTPKVKGETVAMLYLPPAPKIELPKPTPTKPNVKPQVNRAVTARASVAPAYIPPPVTVDTITPPPPPEEDMMARVEAARKRRAEQVNELAQAAPPEAVEDDNQRALRIAHANFASSQKRGNDKEDSGGVFQIKNQTVHSAEFTFRGWNATMRRMWPQQYMVEQGQERDIEIAIVKKMIEVIRKYKDGDFIWESHRMGRQVTLSARVADTAQLQQFLLREFFPNYRQSGNP